MSLIFAPQTVNGRPVLANFRAGTMRIVDGMATPDANKGFVSLIQSSSGILELWWHPIGGTTNSPTATSTIFTYGDATFEKVEKCKTGIVFALCLSGSKDPIQTRLFWCQEANGATKEADIVSRFKNLVGDSECRKRLAAAGTSAAAATATTTTNTATATTTASPTAGSGPISNEALQQILQNLTRNAPRPAAVDINLQQMLGSDELLAALREDPAFYMVRVGEHLPPNHSDDIVSEVRNPQASAAAATLQAAVSESPNTLHEVLTAFGLPTSSASSTGAAAGSAAGASPSATTGAAAAAASPTSVLSPVAAPPSALALCEAIIKDGENKAQSPATGGSTCEGDNASEEK